MLKNEGRFVEVFACFKFIGRQQGPHLLFTSLSARGELLLRELCDRIMGIFPVLNEQLVSGIRHFRWVLCFTCGHLCSNPYNATYDQERKEFHPESPLQELWLGDDAFDSILRLAPFGPLQHWTPERLASAIR